MDERYIVLTVPFKYGCNWYSPIKNFIPEYLFFKDVELFGVEFNDFCREIRIALKHPEFPKISEDERIPQYSLDEAKEKFPLIFRLSDMESSYDNVRVSDKESIIDETKPLLI